MNTVKKLKGMVNYLEEHSPQLHFAVKNDVNNVNNS